MSSPSGPVASPTFGAKSVHTPGAIGAIPATPTARQLQQQRAKSQAPKAQAPKAAPKPTAKPVARKSAPAKAPARRGKR